MICDICLNKINNEITLKNLFLLSFICPECRSKLRFFYEVIPVNLGYSAYYFYFSIEEIWIERARVYLDYKIGELIENNKNKTIIFIDDEDENLDIEAFNYQKNIVLISYRRINMRE